MGHNQKFVVVIICFLLVGVSGPAVAVEIYHWVDEDGVMHFSEWAPNISTVEVSRLTVTNSNPPDYDPHEDQYSIPSQAERTNVRWSELRRQRDERREQRLEAAERASRLAPTAYEPDEHYASSVWYGPVHLRRLGHRHRSKVKFHQQLALDKLGLRNGRRPHSINSSAHLARISARKEAIHGLRSVRPRHGARQPGHRAPGKGPSFREPQ